MPLLALALAMGHGAGGVLGLVIHFAASSLEATSLWIIYVLAGLRGCGLTVYGRIIGDGAPKAMILGHGLVAVLGCTALRLGVYSVLTA